jgi:predicted component of type VI protein secretion system
MITKPRFRGTWRDLECRPGNPVQKRAWNCLDNLWTVSKAQTVHRRPTTCHAAIPDFETSHPTEKAGVSAETPVIDSLNNCYRLKKNTLLGDSSPRVQSLAVAPMYPASAY